MTVVKNRYRSVKVGSRGGTFYCEDTEAGIRKSLFTKDEAEAERLVHAKNEAERQPQLNRRMGMAYLSATDPDVATRTWRFVMDDIIKDKKGSTLKRYQTALKDPAFKLIEARVSQQTSRAEIRRQIGRKLCPTPWAPAARRGICFVLAHRLFSILGKSAER